MNKSHYYQAFALLLAIFNCCSSNIAAANENNLAKQTLVKQAKQFVLNKLNPNQDKTIDVSVMPIDKRITIPVCPNGLKFSASEETLRLSNVTVKAECKNKNWYMFMVVKASEIQPVVVISRAVSPGTLLTRQNTELVNMDKKRLRSSTFADIEDVIGARIKRRVTAGRPVDPHNLCYVCKGDSVTITAGSPTMRVKASGIAQEDGNMGETIRVKNSRSKKLVQARVTSTGNVEINI